MVPVIAFIQKPSHRIGKSRTIGERRRLGAKPRIRKLTPALMPTHSAIPTVWSRRTVGNANIEGDSRTHVERLVLSSHCKNSITAYETSIADVSGQSIGPLKIGVLPGAPNNNVQILRIGCATARFRSPLEQTSNY